MRALWVVLLLIAPVGANHTPCPPEDCVAVVPPAKVPFTQGRVSFDAFDVSVAVQDHVAVTRLRFEISNAYPSSAVEWIAIPMPGSATLTGLNITLPDRVLVGTVQERGQAQRQFDEAAEAGRDAVMVQYNKGTLVNLMVSLPGNSSRIIQASYAEVLDTASGRWIYRFPTELVKPAPTAFTLSLDASALPNSRTPGWDAKLGTALSATELATLPSFVATWEAPTSGLHAVRTTRGGTDYLAAVLCLEGASLSRDVVFILDHSGSMSGQKIEEARQALDLALQSLAPADRFSVVRFEAHVTSYSEALVAATPETVSAARTYVSKTGPDGGTDMDGGLQTGLRQLSKGTGAVPSIVLLTDGLPTVGVTDHANIIERARNANTREAPIYVVPIGLDADYTFLADLALGSGGAYTNIGSVGTDYSEHLGRLLTNLGHPVATGVELTLKGAPGATILPRVPGPIHADACLPVSVVGQIPDGAALEVKATTAAGIWSQTYPLASVAEMPEAANVAGKAVIDDLLSQERQGSPLRQAIIENATALLQLTPYTAWIVVDPAPAPVPEAGADSAATGSGTQTSSYSTSYAPGSTATVGASSSMTSTTPGPALGLVVLAALWLAWWRR